MEQKELDLKRLNEYFRVQFNWGNISIDDYNSIKDICSKERILESDYNHLQTICIINKVPMKNFYKKEEGIDIAIPKNETNVVAAEIKAPEKIKSVKKPVLRVSQLEVTDNDYEKYFDAATEKILSDLKRYDEFYDIAGLDDLFSYNDLDVEKYGDKVAYRDMYLKKSICSISHTALHTFINDNEYIKIKFEEFVKEDVNSDVFNRDFDIYLASLKSSKNVSAKKADEKELLLLKYIFAIRTTYKDSLFEIFPMLTENQITYILKKFEENGLIKMKLNKSNKITSVISSNKLDSMILDTKIKEQRQITSHGYIKERTRNEYIASIVKENNPKTLEELLDIFKSKIPMTIFYKGEDRFLYNMYSNIVSIDTSRFALEYLYTKLCDIHSSLISTIRVMKKNENPQILDNLYKTLIPLNDTLEKLLELTLPAISSFGKFKDFANISLRSLKNSNIFLFDIRTKVDENENYITNSFGSILFLQTTLDYRKNDVIHKCRDIVIYLSSSVYEQDYIIDKCDVFFYDDSTKYKFIKEASRMKSLIRADKNYYYSESRKKLALGLSKKINFIDN